MAELPVWKGTRDRLPIVAAETSALLIPREYTDRVNRVQVLPETIVAPVEKHQVLGKFLITVGTDQLRSIPLQASIGIAKAGMFKSLRHHLYMNGFVSIWSLLIIVGSMVSLCAVAILFSSGKKRRRKSHMTFRLPR